jgi:hypothetical protein
MSPKFTPGRWVKKGLSQIWTEIDGKWRLVCTVAVPFEGGAEPKHQEVFTNLIAAAPDMHQALRQLYDAFFSSADSDHGNALAAAEAAIIKAEGKLDGK